MTRRPPGRRRGAATIEAAIALPLAFVLIFAVIVGGLGVFRYQQVAALAREGSRWASLRGAVYSQESGRPPATAADVYANAIEPMAVGLDRTKITYAAWS